MRPVARAVTVGERMLECDEHPTGSGAVDSHVPESAFGKWFLQTDVWTVHVLERALKDLERLIPHRRPAYPVVADVGCGWGRSLEKLNDWFRPQRLIGIAPVGYTPTRY